MNHKHRKVLHGLFAHPAPSNIHLHDVETALKELGADVSHSGHGRLNMTLNGHTVSVHGSDHGLSKDEVSTLRKFLESCGFGEANFPA